MNLKTSLLSACFFIIAVSISRGQIPNNGFENWTSFGTYMQPDGWSTTNEYSAGPFYAVTRDTSHYPPGAGIYSIRLENNISLGFPEAGGGAKTGDTLLDEARFPITGHPNSLTGYYKFNPQNGDTMTIRVKLFLGPSEVVDTGLYTTIAAPNWTPFNLPLPTYASADSAEILLAAFTVDNNPVPFPSGNSVLYVDNLNFDNLITGLEETGNNQNILIYPNPAIDHFTVLIPQGPHRRIEMLNHLGQVIISRQMSNEEESIIFDTSLLQAGIYSIHLIRMGTVITKRIIIVD